MSVTIRCEGEELVLHVRGLLDQQVIELLSVATAIAFETRPSVVVDVRQAVSHDGGAAAALRTLVDAARPTGHVALRGTV